LRLPSRRFNTYKNKFAQIDRKTPSHLADDVKALAIEGKPVDVALDMLTALRRPKSRRRQPPSGRSPTRGSTSSARS